MSKPAHFPDLNRIDKMLADTVARKLKCPVTLARWIQKPTGDIPVFQMPVEYHTAAQALGLTVQS